MAVADLEARCAVCGDEVDPNEYDRPLHKLCAWATPKDWRALKPWLDGTMMGVTMGGE